MAAPWTYRDFLALWESTPPAYVNGRPCDEQGSPLSEAEEQSRPPELGADISLDKFHVSLVQLDVLGKIEGGKIKVFSTYHRRSEIIPDISRLTYEHLLHMAGPPVRDHVLRSDPDADVPRMITLGTLKDSIAILAGFKRITDETELGVGCWEGRDEAGRPYPSVVVVGTGEAFEVNGGPGPERILHPRCRGHLLDFDTGSEPWYDFEQLCEYIDRAADREWAEGVVAETFNHFQRWRWSHETAPWVITGLVLSTWVQTLWRWRPQVSITGASNTGKSTLLLFLEGLFGNLTLRSSHSTAAGIRQAVRNTAKVILCDEFESGRQRDEILEMLRSAGRGDKTLRGTASQKGQQFGLRHIAWVAAIEDGLRREPDRNRFISLELLRPEEGAKKLVLPTAAEMADLGQRTLAVAIRYVQEARRIAHEMRDLHFQGVNRRVVESYSVPAAMLAAIDGGSNQAEITAAMGKLLSGVPRHDVLPDDQELLQAIFEAHILLGGRERISVSQALNLVIRHDPGHQVADQQLQSVGIRMALLTPQEAAALPPDLKGGSNQCLLINSTAVLFHLLKGSVWERQTISQILARLPGASQSTRKIADKAVRVVILPLEYLHRTFELGRREEAF